MGSSMDDSGMKGAQALLPEGTLSLGYVVILPFIDMEGQKSWLFQVGGDLETVEAIGYLEATKAEIVKRIGEDPS